MTTRTHVDRPGEQLPTALDSPPDAGLVANLVRRGPPGTGKPDRLLRRQRHLYRGPHRHAASGEVARADAPSGDLHLDPRLHRTRGRRPDSPAGRTPLRPAGDTRPERGATRRRERDDRRLESGAAPGPSSSSLSSSHAASWRRRRFVRGSSPCPASSGSRHRSRPIAMRRRPGRKARVAVEADVAMPWSRMVGDLDEIISMKHFGVSADHKTHLREFGFTADTAVATAHSSPIPPGHDLRRPTGHVQRRIDTTVGARDARPTLRRGNRPGRRVPHTRERGRREAHPVLAQPARHRTGTARAREG
jgi:hypothetical protein